MVIFHTLSLLLLGLLSSSLTTSGSTTGGGGSGGTTTGADVGQEVLDILSIESLGEKLGPDRLNIRDVGGLDEGVELVGLLINEKYHVSAHVPISIITNK
jgi:hypothetical protein